MLNPRERLLKIFPQLRAAILLQDAIGDWSPDEVEAIADGTADRIRHPDHFVPEVVDIEDEARTVRYNSTRDKSGKVVRLGKVKRTRYPSRPVRVVETMVVHQMGVERSAESKRWKYVTAQRVIRTDAARVYVHPLTTRLVSANAADRAPLHATNIEVAGNFEENDGDGNYYKPSVFGRGRASLEQLVALAYQINGDRVEIAQAGGALRFVAPHRIFGRNRKGEPNRPLCPGSRLWQASEHIALRLSLRVPEPGEEYGGLPVPDRWRCRIWWAMRGLVPPGDWTDDLSEEEKKAIDEALGR